MPLRFQDKGAYALAEALKANGEAAVDSLNLASNYITKYGKVAITLFFFFFCCVLSMKHIGAHGLLVVLDRWH